MPLPRPVPPPVMRMRLFCSRSVTEHWVSLDLGNSVISRLPHRAYAGSECTIDAHSYTALRYRSQATRKP